LRAVNPSADPDLVDAIFSGSGLSYDEIVAESTGGLDSAWKEELITFVGSPSRILDLACGTGILTFMLRDRFPFAELVGVDRSSEYLRVAIERARVRQDRRCRFVLGDAETAETDGSFDAIVSCYLPKYADLPALAARVRASLAPGGRLVMQDFLYPEHPSVRLAWQRRFESLKRRSAEGWPEALRMFELLPDVIRESRWVSELPAQLVAHGLDEVRVVRQSFGLSALVTARRSAG
jgi:demethylmenaquinone methyltransferase/2-methoxy-6-polyprenyl-1,4-benzoquinol methylase